MNTGLAWLLIIIIAWLCSFQVLAWPDVNTGYTDMHNVEVLRVAGVPVHNLAHMAHMLTNHPGPYVRLDLQWDKVSVRREDPS